MAGSGRGRVDALPDREQRDLILSQLDRNMLVEAAAGTGKTTGMVLRMLALLRSGRCKHIRNMAAVTFTHKAAGEIRSRFQVELERAAREATGAERERLQTALDETEQCFIGTIHSFCARLLRERPVEAGVDPSFRELDDAEDMRLRHEAWERFTALLTFGDEEGLLRELRKLGLKLSNLREAFLHFTDYPDVEEWPLPEAVDLEEICAKARKDLESYLDHLRELGPRLPDSSGKDTLIPLLKSLPRNASHHDLQETGELMRFLESCEQGIEIRVGVWEGAGFTSEDAKREKQRWEDFRTQIAAPALRAWREARYGAAMRALAAASEVYERLKEERGLLSFQDLLMRAASLLRDNQAVRRYFQDRYTHLLVDEFQDTDPIQAEVIFLLVSQNNRERDWRRCRPRPGSLFLVGDPKQSIYRFRRADIVTYREAKKRLLDSGGVMVTLSANFRSLPSLIDWVNRVFAPAGEDEGGSSAMTAFPREDCEHSPAYVTLLPAREENEPGSFQGVFRLPIPHDLSNKKNILPYEAEIIARFIRDALDAGVTVPRTQRERELGLPPHALPSDFMILTRNTINLHHYAEKLQEYGIPHVVSGGNAFRDVEELGLLHLCLQALARPHDPVALVALLRSELFGISDAALYSYKKRGGSFSVFATVPRGLPAEDERAFSDAFTRLARYREWLARMPPAAACERIAADLGLTALAAARPRGDMRAGALAKALELLRRAERETWSLARLVSFLGDIITGEESYEGLSALCDEPYAVRVLNLHKAKGLEAPVVFLADPTGEKSHAIKHHVDRSGETTRGYLSIHTRKGQGEKIVARPAGWDSLEERERAFQQAEDLRLKYVAATRAGVACIVSVREKNPKYSPWNFFTEHLGDRPVLPVPERVQNPVIEGEALGEGEIGEAARHVEERRLQARKTTYHIIPAKEYAPTWVSGSGRRPEVEPVASETGEGTAAPQGKGGRSEKTRSIGDEHGMEWGEVIHLLLQVTTERPQADLLSLARSALREKDLDPSLAEEAVRIARAIIASPLWERVLRSDCRLVEVPFHFPFDDGCGVPTVVRGAVDLAFREDGGWVLVDYKTGGAGGGKTREPEADHAAQILFYAWVWERCTGQKVKEALVYLVEEGLLYRVS